MKEGFDLVFTACVMHHIDPKERDAWVDAVLSRMNPGGYWAIFEHNLINPYTKRIVTDVDNKVDDVNWMYSRKKLLGLFENKKNVNVFWQGYTLFSPFRSLSLITNIERLLKWCPLGAQQCVVIQKQENK